MSPLLRRTVAPGIIGRPAITTINAAAVSVPADFLGMHLHRYPINPAGGPPDPAPAFQYGGYRSHDGCPCWYAIQPTLGGGYDWTIADDIIDYQAGEGRSVIYTMYGTPTWAARPGLQGYDDPYGYPGGASPPADFDDAANFITALLTQYNSGATRKIQYLELWNEPSYGQLPGTDLFWWGSALDLVQMNAVMVAAAKAVDPGITILSPGFTDVQNLMATWLDTYDPISAQKGVDLIDGVAIHPYGNSYYGSTSFYDGTDSSCSVRQAQKAVAAAGGPADMATYITEYGLGARVTDQAVVDFLAQTSNNRRIFAARMLAVAAARGAKFFGIYSYNSMLFGDLFTDTYGVIDAINDIQAVLPGNTIPAGGATIDQLGKVTITLASGAVHTW